jgi:hypothetical protein
MNFARRTNSLFFLTLILLLVPACEPEEETPDAGGNDASITDVATDDAATPDASDVGEECDRFCVFDRWLDALDGSTFVGCMCQTQMPDVTAVSRSMIDACLRNEQRTVTDPRNPVEAECVEALSADQLQEVVDVTSCYIERTAQVSPCVRAMQVGALCSSCEHFESPDERFPCTVRPETSDRMNSCVDGIPGFL